MKTKCVFLWMFFSFVFLSFFIGCDNDDKENNKEESSLLIGIWELLDDYDGTNTWIFNSDGTSVYNYIDDTIDTNDYGTYVYNAKTETIVEEDENNEITQYKVLKLTKTTLTVMSMDGLDESVESYKRKK